MKTDYKVFLEEKAKKEARKKELEQKYKEIENMAISKAEEEVKYFE
ncbi:MAG: hypothetical protein LBQ24_03915 [Candidatus Peribacteria bacterium]|jgi:cell division septum initiation protein DivIVA|nr:hypothetical protein [Candidatus Peribacteria bacterium]